MARPPAAVCRPILAERHPPLARYKKRGVLAAGAAGGGERWAGCAPRSSAVPRCARLCPAAAAAALGGAGRRSQHGAAYQRGEQSAGGAGPGRAERDGAVVRDSRAGRPGRGGRKYRTPEAGPGHGAGR